MNNFGINKCALFLHTAYEFPAHTAYEFSARIE